MLLKNLQGNHSINSTNRLFSNSHILLDDKTCPKTCYEYISTKIAWACHSTVTCQKKCSSKKAWKTFLYFFHKNSHDYVTVNDNYILNNNQSFTFFAIFCNFLSTPGHSSHHEEWKKMSTSLVASLTTLSKVVPTTTCNIQANQSLSELASDQHSSALQQQHFLQTV